MAWFYSNGMATEGPFDTKAQAEEAAQAEVDYMRTRGSIGGFHIRYFERRVTEAKAQSDVRAYSMNRTRAQMLMQASDFEDHINRITGPRWRRKYNPVTGEEIKRKE